MNTLKKIRKPLYLAALLLAAANAFIGFRWMHPAASAPEVFGDLPAFSLTNVQGRPFTRKHLLGRVWAVDFFYTRCEESCPAQSAEMARLQREYAAEPDLGFLSITVDPVHDTPEVLARYAASLQARPDRWIFLTGKESAIAQLAREGFRLAYAVRSSRREMPTMELGAFFLHFLLSPPSAYAHHVKNSGVNGLSARISHSSRFVLLDRSARVRGYYLSDDADALRRLRRDIGLLLREAH